MLENSQLRSVAISVVLYEPNAHDLERVYTVSSWSVRVYVIDNSSSPRRLLNRNGSNFEYKWMGNRRGLAGALNNACESAKNDGYEYLLTLDQDTIFAPEILKLHIHQALKVFRNSKIAIVGGRPEGLPKVGDRRFSERGSVITSGSIIRLSAWNAVKGFNELLFIDQLDHEICYRLRAVGYKILINQGICFEHTIGNPKSYNFLGRRIMSTNHSPLRRYYQIRNMLYLRKQCPNEAKPLLQFIREIVELISVIVLFENFRIKKLLAILYGFIDFNKGQIGQIESSKMRRIS